MNLSHYTKTWGPLIVAFLTAALTAFQGTLAQQPVMVGLSIALAIVNVVITYRVTNADSGIWSLAKAWANVLHVGLQTVLALVATAGGFDRLAADQWSIVGLAILGGIMTFIFPNEPKLVFANPADPRL